MNFFPGIALYLIYKTLKIAWLHIQVVSSNRAPRIERLYFSSTNKDCLSSVFGRGSHMRGAGYRYTRLWKANQSITGGQWPWKFTWRSSSPLLFWRCFCCASTCIFIFIYGCKSTHHFMRPWQTLRSSKSLFVRVFYGEKVEKEGRRELSIRDETSGDKLLKTLNKKKVVQTGIRMKASSALRANSWNESYNETRVSEKRRKLQEIFTKTEKCHNSYSGVGRGRSSFRSWVMYQYGLFLDRKPCRFCSFLRHCLQIRCDVSCVEGLNVINDPKCNKVLKVIKFCPKCNKLLSCNCKLL